MSEAIVAGWFPVVTLLLGFGTKFLADWAQDHRNIKRDRATREIDRKNKSLENHAEFQRVNLLDLQEADFQLARATGAAYHQDEMAFRATGKWSEQLLPDDLDQTFHLSQTRTSILGVRIRDDTVRSLTKEFKAACAESVLSLTQEQSNHAMSNMSRTFEALNDRIGELLRKLDANETIP